MCRCFLGFLIREYDGSLMGPRIVCLEVPKVLRRALAEESCPEDRVHCGHDKKDQEGVAKWEGKKKFIKFTALEHLR